MACVPRLGIHIETKRAPLGFYLIARKDADQCAAYVDLDDMAVREKPLQFLRLLRDMLVSNLLAFGGTTTFKRADGVAE